MISYFSSLNQAIKFSDYEIVDEQQLIEDLRAKSANAEEVLVKSDNERESEQTFVTGHRIPLELFSTATLR